MQSFTTSDGVRIVYEDVGAPDGVPVVLCHGLAAAGAQMASEAEHFAGLGYRVLLPDVRGHGRSGKPEPTTRAAFAIDRMAEDMCEMLDHADAGPVHWVGNSMGGTIALAMLRRDSARFRSLTTFGTVYALNVPIWAAAAIPLTYGAFGAGLTAWLTARVTTRAAAARPLIARLVRDFDPEVGRLTTENLARYDFIAAAAAATERLPILMLRGGRDLQVNAALGPTLKAMRDRAGFTLVELPEGGHCANLDATGPWRAALVDFWGRAGLP